MFTNSTYGFAKLYFVESIQEGMRRIFKVPALTMVQAEKKFRLKNKGRLNRIKYRISLSERELHPPIIGIDESLIIDRFKDEQHELMVERMLTLWCKQKRPISAASPPPAPEQDVDKDIYGMMFV